LREGLGRVFFYFLETGARVSGQKKKKKKKTLPNPLPQAGEG
jgi:hypothetical protein